MASKNIEIDQANKMELNLSIASTINSNENESINKELTEKEINERSELNNQFEIINLNKSSTKSIDPNYLNDELNKTTNLNKLATKQNDNLLSENTNKWLFRLDWDLKEKLIKLVNDYTKLLIINKKISINKKELVKSKDDLIKLLTKSPFNLDGRSNDSKVIVNIDNEFRFKIIPQLEKNEYFIIGLDDPIDENLKIKLIEENNNLVNKLVNLPAEFAIDEKLKGKFIDWSEFINNDNHHLVNDEFDDSYEFDEETGESDEETGESEDELVNQSKELNNLKEQLVDLKENHNLELNCLNKKIEAETINLKNQLDQIHIDGKIPFTLDCVIKDIKKFFEKDNEFTSDPIEFLNINWFIRIKSQYMNDSKRYLQCYLRCINEIDDKNNVKWECETSGEFILKNNLPNNKSDLIQQMNYTYKNSEGYGFAKFINEDDLFNLENGYMKDDSISLQIKFKVHKLVRNI